MKLHVGNKNKPNQSRKGQSAIQFIARNSKDAVSGAVNFVKKRYSGKGAPQNIAKDLMMLKSLINTEEKQIFTLATNQTVVSTSSLVYGIGTVAQGNASNQREGDSIKISRIDLNLLFFFSSGTAILNYNQIFNWYLIKYNKTPSTSGTTAFAISEFLNQDAGTNYTPISFPNPDTNQNFTVLDSGQVTITLPFSVATNAFETKIVSISKPCSFHQFYSGSANTTITDNMTYVVVTAANPINTGGNSGVAIESAMWYIDN